MSLYVHILVGLTIPGVALTATLLIFYACLAWNPISRKHLDRVSFRLLVYALLAKAHLDVTSLIFGIVYCMATLNASPSWTCGLISALMNMSLIFSAGMFHCMALNLPLVLGQKVNGQRMEMYYVSGTSFVSVTTTLIPWASGNLGWDAANQSCWYRNSDPEIMFRWLLATQTFWILLACIGEVVAFLAIVGYLISYEFETRYYRRSSVKSSASSPHPGSTILKFRNIVLRIGLYPLVSCLLNISAASLDLHQMKHPEQTDLNIALNLADLAIYAARPLIYGLLAATDPSFIRALRALQSPLSAYSNQRTDPCFTTVVDFPWEISIAQERMVLVEENSESLMKESTTIEVQHNDAFRKRERPPALLVGLVLYHFHPAHDRGTNQIAPADRRTRKYRPWTKPRRKRRDCAHRGRDDTGSGGPRLGRDTKKMRRRHCQPLEHLRLLHLADHGDTPPGTVVDSRCAPPSSREAWTAQPVSPRMALLDKWANAIPTISESLLISAPSCAR
ncbi:hypothetical protein C8R45DRAFT_1112542 [Mycena sanguinolenta]|nr:hypothetical protein C8R45DRAFT_1112542 [Mycena sanguinolenta]